MMILKVTWQMVNPSVHPEYVCPCGCGVLEGVFKHTIPEEHWSDYAQISEPTENSVRGVIDQYRGLLEQEASAAELVRDVQLWTAPEPVWVPAPPGGILQL